MTLALVLLLALPPFTNDELTKVVCAVSILLEDGGGNRKLLLLRFPSGLTNLDGN